MKPDGRIKVTLTLSTEDRYQAKSATIWDLAAATQGLDAFGAHTKEVIPYNPLLRVGRFAIENAEAEMNQHEVGLSECSDFTLTIDARNLAAALELRQQILTHGMKPNVTSTSDAEAISRLRAA